MLQHIDFIDHDIGVLLDQPDALRAGALRRDTIARDVEPKASCRFGRQTNDLTQLPGQSASGTRSNDNDIGELLRRDIRSGWPAVNSSGTGLPRDRRRYAHY